jgi:formylglycine-generating enzyme required for sulfatase activity
VVNVHAQSRKPYTKDAIVGMLKGEVAPQRVAVLARQRGIDFQITPEVESELRQAGATDELMAALREVAPQPPKYPEKPAEIIVQTSPSAEVYVDDQFVGRASPEGRLVIGNAKPGPHNLRASLPGKKEFQQSFTVQAGQESNIEAPLPDLAGGIRVHTLAGAEVFVDSSSQGMADAAGQLVIQEVAPGSHELRVRAQGKREFRQSVTVQAGQEATIEARLENLGPKPGPVLENPKDGLKYIWIPPGTFMMGCSPGDSECGAEEKPAHEVTITKGFWMGQTPVTVGAYKRFADATGRRMPPTFKVKNGQTNQNMPIVNVNWVNAQAYCGWMGGRLPTEAEWEYAARGGSTEARYGNLDEIAWYRQNSGGRTHDVAQKRANGFGLYDMLGNVWEWANDWYDASYYHNGPSQDPQGPARGQGRVQRSGCYGDDPRFVRVSYRGGNNPTFKDFNYYGVGFRCGGELGNP